MQLQLRDRPGPACLAGLLIVLAAACGGGGREAPRTSSWPGWVGSWLGEPCGERGYPRRIEIDAAGAYTMLDLVSPCPPESTCVWSGIVESRGTWKAEGDGVALVEIFVHTPGQAAPRPGRLRRSDPGASRADYLTDEAGCVYAFDPSGQEM